jgi:hypothetical protein
VDSWELDVWSTSTGPWPASFSVLSVSVSVPVPRPPSTVHRLRFAGGVDTAMD